LTGTRARLEQMENGLAAAEAERKKLSAALDEANERRQSECYALNLKLEATRSRAATAEKLLAEVRQNLSGRTEEIRASERKVVDATVALNAHEKKIERLSALREAQDRHKQELEQSHATLTERSNSLVETVKAREASLAHAEDKIKLLANRLEQLELDMATTRAKTEKRIEDLNAAVQRERMERAVTEGALETTRRDYARLQRELLAERASRQRNPDIDESSDKSKEPAKSKNGKGSGRGGKAEGAENKPAPSR
jgi:crescentin